MGKKLKKVKDTQTGRGDRVKLSAEESLKRMQEFASRKESFVASVRKSQDRGVSA